MSDKTDYLKNAQINTMRDVALSAPADMYVGLFSTIPADDGTGGVELSGGSYARQAVTLGAPAAGVSSNSGEVAFPVATGNQGTAIGWGLFDAAAAGNLWWKTRLGGAPLDFIGLAADDFIYALGHTFVNTDEIVFTGASVPGGLTAGTKYFVRDAATDKFKVAATSGGAAIDLTANGTGVVQTDLRKTINTGDQAKFAIGDLVVKER